MTDHSERFAWGEKADECHLFTDGTCQGGTLRLHHLCAWAVVNATLDRCVAQGVLGGVGQCNDRAELRAVICAVEYALHQDQPATICTDSTYAKKARFAFYLT